MAGYTLGLDLGQAQDYTALAGLRTVAQATGTLAEHECGLLRRWPLGTPYPTIVADVRKLLASPPLDKALLVLDYTGVGRAVADLFAPLGGRRVPVTITAGSKATRDEDARTWRVPKKDLVSVVQVLLQGQRLHVAQALPEAATLVRELLAFRVKITAHANETFEAWRESAHDDLVLALALAAWYAERGRPFTAAAGGTRTVGGTIGDPRNVPPELGRWVPDPRSPWQGTLMVQEYQPR